MGRNPFSKDLYQYYTCVNDKTYTFNLNIVDRRYVAQVQDVQTGEVTELRNAKGKGLSYDEMRATLKNNFGIDIPAREDVKLDNYVNSVRFTNIPKYLEDSAQFAITYMSDRGGYTIWDKNGFHPQYRTVYRYEDFPKVLQQDKNVLFATIKPYLTPDPKKLAPVSSVFSPEDVSTVIDSFGANKAVLKDIANLSVECEKDYCARWAKDEMSADHFHIKFAATLIEHINDPEFTAAMIKETPIIEKAIKPEYLPAKSNETKRSFNDIIADAKQQAKSQNKNLDKGAVSKSGRDEI